jgi:hypothetical protein
MSRFQGRLHPYTYRFSSDLTYYGVSLKYANSFLVLAKNQAESADTSHAFRSASRAQLADRLSERKIFPTKTVETNESHILFLTIFSPRLTVFEIIKHKRTNAPALLCCASELLSSGI